MTCRSKPFHTGQIPSQVMDGQDKRWTIQRLKNQFISFYQPDFTERSPRRSRNSKKTDRKRRSKKEKEGDRRKVQGAWLGTLDLPDAHFPTDGVAGPSGPNGPIPPFAVDSHRLGAQPTAGYCAAEKGEDPATELWQNASFVAMPGAPSSVLAVSSKARSPQ